MHASKERLLDAAETLVAYLNLPRGLPQRDSIEPIEHLLGRLSELGHVHARLCEEENGLSRKEINRRDAEFEQAQMQLNASLASLASDAPILQVEGWDVKSRPTFHEIALGAADIRVHLVSRLFELIRAGLSDRVRKCAHCGVWFFARKPWAKFHPGGVCKEAAARSTDKFREHNLAYQTKYYKNWLSPYRDLYRKGHSTAEVRQIIRDRKRKRGTQRRK
jgi:hypothetical protein